MSAKTAEGRLVPGCKPVHARREEVPYFTISFLASPLKRVPLE